MRRDERCRWQILIPNYQNAGTFSCGGHCHCVFFSFKIPYEINGGQFSFHKSQHTIPHLTCLKKCVFSQTQFPTKKHSIPPNSKPMIRPSPFPPIQINHFKSTVYVLRSSFTRIAENLTVTNLQPYLI